MALVSVVPLASKLCLRRSFFSSTHELKAIRRTIPNLGMCRRGPGSVTPASMSMILTTLVSDDGGVQRRVGDYHSNLWDDDYLQSLSTPYGEPAYHEHADRLIGEVKDMFNLMSVEDGELMSPLNDLLQRLLMVDTVERLGIDRHFKYEIKTALDYVYSYWNEKGIGCGRESVVTDLNSTALGLRTLRLHRYRVSSDVLEHFKDQKGQFTWSAIQTEEDIRSVLYLYRASLIAFPGEKVMEEAEISSAMYLKEALQKAPVSSLSQEIEYALDYGWHTNLPRLEARTYIDIYGQDTRSETPFMNTEKFVKLAKLEFNIFHSIQQRELQSLSRWWKDYGFPELRFTRHRHVEYYTFSSCIAIDPQHSAFRLGYAKMCHLVTVLDDIYDTFGTAQEIKLFTAAIKRWDSAATEFLPEYMKGVYMAVYDSVNEMAREAEKVQGRDTLSYTRQAWETYMDAYMEEAKWIANGYVPKLEEYLDITKVSFGSRIATLQPILTLGDPLPLHILQDIDFPSKFNDLQCAILRLKGDTRCYEADRARGEESSSVSCYMKENPGLTEEDAINHINCMVNNLIKEQNWELLKPDDNVPFTAKKHSFDITRVFHYGYKYRDGYSVANMETKNLVMRTLLEPVPM